MKIRWPNIAVSNPLHQGVIISCSLERNISNYDSQCLTRGFLLSSISLIFSNIW
jgi:hypothetical protein